MKLFKTILFILFHFTFSQKLKFRPEPKIRHQKTSTDGLTVSVVTNGSYSLLVNGATWLNNAPTFFNANNKTFSAADNTLKLVQTSATSGTDKLGQWQTTNFQYKTNDKNGVQFTAGIKTYLTLPIVIFQQTYTDGANGTQAANYEGICGGFPGFQIEGQPGLLGYLSYGGLMFGDTEKKIGTWYYQTTKINDGITGGPLAIFDRKGNTLIVSPFNNFMSASFLHDNVFGGNFYGGIMGGVSEIPQGYTQEYIVYYGAGINKAFDGWGQLLRKFYDKDTWFQLNDPTLTHLGYWTDNGAYYYYATENNTNYQNTMVDVKSYADKVGIPYGYFQYDSWWYYKGAGNGVKTWTSRPDIFPDGLRYVASKTGLPVAAHNRYWSPDTTYAKQNGGKYDFIVEKYKALPISEAFWIDLIKNGTTDWKLALYEQDWLNIEFSGLDALLHNLTLGDTWLTQMHTAAAMHGVFIQYCMANPRHAMQALKYPYVTQARVSNDYSPGGNQWNIGISSIFAAAMGVAPYKDTFWTNETQPGNRYGKTEPNWRLNGMVSVLSTGPVGPSDMIGATNVQELMKCCNKDGKILKPQYPIRAIDAQILEAAFGNTGGPDGEVWMSYTDIGGLRFAQLMVLNLANGSSYTIHPADTGLFDNASDTDLYAVPYDEPSGWVTFNQVNGLTFTDKFNPTRVALYHISTAIPGWGETVIFGELDKWVPMSKQRVFDLTWSNTEVQALLYGAHLEKFDFYYILNTKEGSVSCMMDEFGYAVFRIYKASSTVICGPQ